ncbi:MAG TPA: DegT/DnrJ/EryC1/StrS family aminotransferase [Candidatus Eremiobacteraceae bacterium]|nr:DegT/DnrJ/EryC1/StrS family aminotransferase [Candidatus Eremiobacteraceae bacterium]
MPRRQLLPTVLAHTIGVGNPTISPLAIANVLEVLRSNRLTYGPFSRRFEQEFSAMHGADFGIFCNSGTSALQVALDAIRISRRLTDGDEVLVPALTFVATINTALHNRLKPVLVDVDPDYYLLDPEKIEARITSRTRAIIPVHAFGQPADMARIAPIAERHDLSVIEDSAEAVLVRTSGRAVGSWGNVACFSTYAAHHLSTGVGGLATTSDPSLAQLIRSLVNHGRDTAYTSIDDDDVEDRDTLAEVVSRRFLYHHIGYSYRATELEAALGCAALEELPEIVRGHQSAAARLSAALAPLESEGLVQLPRERDGTEHSYMMYPIVVAAHVDVGTLISHLECSGIETRPMLPILQQPAYANVWTQDEIDGCPVAESLGARGFYIGCHDGMTEEAVLRVAQILEDQTWRSMASGG